MPHDHAHVLAEYCGLDPAAPPRIDGYVQHGWNVGDGLGPGTPYDDAAQGGTTTVQVTPTGEVIRAFTSLNGTMMNCSGGVMPWGSWITCEETVNGPDVGPDFTNTPNTAYEKPHGYVFEVPSDKESALAHEPVPLTAAGRFAHEAVSWDPEHGHLYMTEDDFGYASGFYRYIPDQRPEVGEVEQAGLQLRLHERPRLGAAELELPEALLRRIEEAGSR